MKERLWKIMSFLTVVLLVFSLINQMEMKEEIESLKNTFASRLENVNLSVSSIYAGIDEHLEKQDDILSSFRYEYGKPDYEKGEVDFTVMATPKEYIEGETEMHLFCGKEEFPMTMEKGEGRVTISVSVFDEIELTKITVTVDGKVFVQELSEIADTKGEVIPTINVDFMPSVTCAKSGEKTMVNVDGYARFDVYCADPTVKIRSIIIREKIDGKAMLDEINVPLQNSSPDEMKGYFDMSAEQEMRKTYSLDVGQKIAFEVDVLDNYGYTYTGEIFSYVVPEVSEERTDETIIAMLDGGIFDVYSPEGKLLHKGKDGEFNSF